MLRSETNSRLPKEDFAKIDVAGIYDENGMHYEKTHFDDPGRVESVQWLLSQMPSREAHILDIGCCAGRPIVETLAKDGKHHVLGIDLSPKMIELARKQVPNAQFEVADIRTWSPNDGEKFDGIASFFVFMHLHYDDMREAIAKVASWLNPGGSFVYGGVSDVNGHVRWMEKDVCATSCSVDETVALLEEVGFVVVKAYTHLFQPTGFLPKENQIFWCKKA